MREGRRDSRAAAEEEYPEVDKIFIEPSVAKLAMDRAHDAELRVAEIAQEEERERAYEARRAKIIAQGGDPDAVNDSDEDEDFVDHQSASGLASYVSY